jgi:hypothetical protein
MISSRVIVWSLRQFGHCDGILRVKLSGHAADPTSCKWQLQGAASSPARIVSPSKIIAAGADFQDFGMFTVSPDCTALRGSTPVCAMIFQRATLPSERWRRCFKEENGHRRQRLITIKSPRDGKQAESVNSLWTNCGKVRSSARTSLSFASAYASARETLLLKGDSVFLLRRTA